MCGFIAQLVEQRTGNAEVTGSNPVEALIFFFQASSFQLLKLKIHCEDHSSLSSITAVQNELFHLFHIMNICVCLGDYSPIFTSPEATNCFSIITLMIIQENKIIDQFSTQKHQKICGGSKIQVTFRRSEYRSPR